MILDVSVSAEPRVVCQIPAGVVRIFVDHHLVSRPVPARDDAVVVRRDVPIVIPKPEPFPVSSAEHENMLWPETTGITSVRPRLFDAIVRVVPSAVMPHPLIVLGVNVWIFGMPRLVLK